MLFNKRRALEMMQGCSLDVLVAASPVSVTYFTDYSCWIDPLFKDYMMSPGASTGAAPPSASTASKFVARAVMTLTASLLFTVAMALPA